MVTTIARAVAVRSAFVHWLRKNQDARPTRDTKTARRQMRMARAQRQRIFKRNAPLLKQSRSAPPSATRVRGRTERLATHYASKARPV